MRIVRVGSTVGSAAGVGIAIAMISLVMLRPFSVPVNGFIDRATLGLCPLYILGFSSYVKNWPELSFITIAGNAVLYGALGAIIALMIAPFRRR